MTWFDAAQLGAVFTGLGVQGGDSLNLGDPRRQGQAVVDHINERGGMGGRMVRPVWFEQPAEETVTEDGKDRSAQRFCATFTEDSQVFAIVQPLTGSDGQVACAGRTQTPLVGTSPLWAVDQEWFDEIAHYFYLTPSMLKDRREHILVAGLAGQGFFEPDATVGLMVENRPQTRRSTERALKPALASLGVEPAAEIYWGPDATQSPWPSYVLQMRQAGVTHIIFASSLSPLSPAFFMRAAESQLYRPRYGLASDTLLTLNQAAAPPEQLEGVQGVGWLPQADTGDSEHTRALLDTSSASTCRDIMAGAGEPETVGLGYCEGLFFLKAALDRAERTTAEGLAQAVGTLGDTFGSVMTWRTRFAPNRHDGPNMVRDFAYDPGCRCFEYTSGGRELD